jgi:adenosine deaminase
VEARYSPQLFANKMKDGAKPPYALSEGDITPEEVVKIICNAFDKGSRDFGINVKSILCCVEHKPGKIYLLCGA